MNGKRIAAIIGLIGMGVCILCIVVAGFVPALKDLFWMIGMLAFLVAASISLIFTMRKAQKQSENDAEEKP
ncbi:MAG: hypothetical protein IJE07_14375 [Clostridia bacterium]|nr:hypothetical protein [Clostridia bacterium]